MEGTPILIDLSYLHSLTGGDKSFEHMLLSGTVEDVDAKVKALQNAWEGGQATDVRKNAHSLVSLAAIAGMPQVEGWSRKLDQAFADGNFHAELAPLAHDIITGWPAAHAQLATVLADINP